MDERSFIQLRTLARYVIFLAVMIVASVMGSMWLIVVLLADSFTEKTAIISMMVGALAGAITTLIAGISAAFVAIANARKNVSVTEAQGRDNEQ